MEDVLSFGDDDENKTREKTRCDHDDTTTFGYSMMALGPVQFVFLTPILRFCNHYY